MANRSDRMERWGNKAHATRSSTTGQFVAHRKEIERCPICLYPMPPDGTAECDGCGEEVCGKECREEHETVCLGAR